jgi:hypothetical protein
MARATARYVRSRTKSLRTRLGVFGIVALLAAIAVGVVFAASVPPIHIGGSNNDGKSCAENFPGTSELKLDQGASGTVTLGAFSVNATIPSAAPGAPAASLDFTANGATTVIGVIVKDGVDGANKYDYSPDGVQSDTNLTTPGPPIGTFKGISHVIFCVVGNEASPDPLDVEKTAAGTYDREITWTLDKSVDDDSHSGAAGQTAGTSTWKVVATKNVDENGFLVSGEITVSNTNDFDVPFSLADELDTGDDATIACPVSGDETGTVPANGSVTCDYSVATTDATATENEVEVTPGNPDIGGDSDTAPITWTANVTGDEEVDLGDDRGPLNEHLTDSGTFTYPEEFKCSSNADDYTNGSDIDNYPNTATLKGDSTDLKDDAEVTVTCTLDALEVAKTAAGTYDRTVEWTLEKSVDKDSHSGTAGTDAGTSEWKVLATKSEVIDNWAITGTITIGNPATVAQSFTVSDVLDDGTKVVVICPDDTVPAGGQVVCDYFATPDDATAALNTATVSAPGNEDQEATAEVKWTENLIGDETVALKDDRKPLDETIGNSTTETYPETFPCPADASQYVDGKLEYSVTNTATLTGPNTDLEDDATVKVTCTLPALTVKKTAAGTLDRKYTWTIDKEVVDATVNPVKYKVTVKPDGGTDSNWKVTGTITIDNPAAIAQSFTVGDEFDNGTNATVTCPSNTVAAGGSVTCTYSEAQTDASATKNTATVKAAGNADQVATAPVSFAANLIDECTDVYDDNGTPGNTADDKFLGKVCIDSAKKYFEYTIDFAVSDGQCKTITNTASSITEDTKTKATDSVTVKYCKPATPGYWKNHLASSKDSEC